jgi:hypothetical protein
MPDPAALDPTSYQYYAERNPPSYWYEKPRTLQQLQLDLNKAHDNLRTQVRVNDVLRRQNTVIAKAIKRERNWRRALVTVVGSLIGFIGWAFVHLGPFIVKGMAK